MSTPKGATGGRWKLLAAGRQLDPPAASSFHHRFLTTTKKMLTKGATGGRRELLAAGGQRDRGKEEGGFAQFGFGFGFQKQIPKVLLSLVLVLVFTIYFPRCCSLSTIGPASPPYQRRSLQVFLIVISYF